MYHQANFWRRTAGGEYDDDYAHFVDYVGRAHTTRGADARLFIEERYVIGMVGFVQHAIIDSLQRELREYNPELEMAAVKAWNKLCMVILEMLSRAYGHERNSETFAQLIAVDPQEIHDLSVASYEKSLNMRRRYEFKDVVVGAESEIPDGERKIIQAENLSIGVFHHKGQWYAIRNLCLHRGGPVATGKLAGNNIICPWHGYTYDVTTGRLLLDPTARLDTYPVKIVDGQVIVIVPVGDQEEAKIEIGAGPLAAAMAQDTAPAAVAEQHAAEKGDASQAAPVAQPTADTQPAQTGNGGGTRSLSKNEFLTTSILPGEIGLVEVDGEEVAVYNVDGTFYATENGCTHVGGPLNEGELNGNEVVCPWHGSCFNVTNGAVTCPPAKKPLRTFRVTVEGEAGRVEA
jgi:nitrite reductase/ring-hydroxylating ferredoxin subunit